jgi:acetyl esterase/lipase
MSKTQMKRAERRPDIARAFAHLASEGIAADPLAAMRAQVEHYGEVDPRPGLSGVVLVPTLAGGVPAEWILPDGEATSGGDRIVYLHGGGWVAGSLNSHRPIAAELARMSGCAVLLVGYRLAPEYPFPAGFNDCRAALAWAALHGPDGLGRANRLLLAGDSAGANLAAAITLQALEQGDPVADRLLLICPPMDARVNLARGPAADESGDHAALEAVMGLYLQEADLLDDPRVSPLRSVDRLLAQFPPTLIQASTAEFLLWDAQEFSRRLAAAGRRVTLSIWADLPHVWHAFLSLLPEAKGAIAEGSAFLTAERQDAE